MKFNHRLLPAFFLLFSFQTFAQLSGVVLDENGEPLPYASVYERNSTRGTAANAEGEFKLPLERGQHEVVFRYIGYQQKIETVTIGDKPVRLRVRLVPNDLQIAEVVISSEDPAYAIMRKAIERRPYYKNRIPAYACDVYMKGFYKLGSAPKKLFGQEIGDMDGTLDSTGKGVIYLSESVSKLYVQATPPRKKEVMVSSKVSGSPNGFSVNRATLVDFNLYNERVNVDRDILSPLADNAFSYYRFRLLGRYWDEDRNMVYKIEVTPKRDEDPVFGGYLYILDEGWNLAGADLFLTGKAIQQPVLDTLRIRQSFVRVGRPDEWCLLSQTIGLKFAVLGFRIDGFFNGVFSNYDLRPAFAPDFFDLETFKVEKEATERDTTYWAGVRPVPLTAEERLDYTRKDSLYILRNSPAYLDSIDRRRNRFNLEKLFFGYTWRNSKKYRSVSYPSLLEGWQFNSVQGWLIDFRPGFRFADNKRGSRYWSGTGWLNYGFSEKRLRAGLRLARRFESIHYTEAELSGGTNAVQFDDEGQIGPTTNLLYSLFEKKNYLKLYEKAWVQGRFGRNVATGLRLEASLEYAERRPLLNHSDYSFYRRDRAYQPNAPLPPPAGEPETEFFARHQAFVGEVSLRIRFGERYSSYPDFRYSEDNDRPELSLSYRKAVAGVAGSDADFDLLSIRLRQRELGMGLVGYTSWSLAGGWFARRVEVPLMDYYHPNGNQTFLGNPRTYDSGFFLLPYYEFSTSDGWAEAHLRHHFNGWILDKIPLLRRLNWKEVIGFSAYYTESYAVEGERPGTDLPYWEASFGFENIGIRWLRPLHVDVAVGFFGDKWYRTGVVLGLRL